MALYLTPETLTTVVGIELIFNYNSMVKPSEVEQWCRTYQKLSSIVQHSAPSQKAYEYGNTQCAEVTQTITSETHCGIVNQAYFTPNIQMFSEAQQHNSCLNRKISVDVKGEIKNCPSMSQGFGNIQTTSFIKALETEGFKKSWSVSKDQIDICRDCEFRYICTDCRAYTQEASQPYSKPAKCDYNPYTATWKKNESNI
jgi:SPASM domain peptide maturase of grasp-with-spasm system